MASEEATEFFLKWNSHHNVLVSVLDTLLTNQKLVDITLSAEGKFIHAHRVVLFACSSYFEVIMLLPNRIKTESIKFMYL